MLTATALACINHPPTGEIGEAWATARLRPFAGRAMYARCPPVDLHIKVSDAGALRAAPGIEYALRAAPSAIDIRLIRLILPTSLTFPPAARMVRVTQWLAAGFVKLGAPGASRTPAGKGFLTAARARIEDAADRADTPVFHRRNLRRDVGDDLSRCAGDIAAQPARWLAQGGRAVFSGVSRAARAFARNFAESFSEETSLILGRVELGALARPIDALSRDTTSLKQRLERLGGMEIRTCAHL